MFTIIKWSRLLLPVLGLAVFTPMVGAQSRTTEADPGVPAGEGAASGSPELGMLIIAGVIAFLILVAWLLTRVGDDSRRGGDRNLLG